jgi:hypothetical protein
VRWNERKKCTVMSTFMWRTYPSQECLWRCGVNKDIIMVIIKICWSFDHW